MFKDSPYTRTNILGSQKRDLRYSTIEERLRWKEANKNLTKEKRLCSFCSEVLHKTFCCGKKTVVLESPNVARSQQVKAYWGFDLNLNT